MDTVYSAVFRGFSELNEVYCGLGLGFSVVSRFGFVLGLIELGFVLVLVCNNHLQWWHRSFMKC